MFTGIIREVGTVVEWIPSAATGTARVAAPQICAEMALGDSICVNGACLTVSAFDSRCFSADLSGETLHRTTFTTIRVGDRVNLESSLRPHDRMGGHWVTGHVDGVGVITRMDLQGEFSQMVVRFPPELERYIAEKGSICIDGISLTPTYVQEDCVGVAVIPFTLEQTNLRTKQPGDRVNIEVDILARYVERLLHFDQGPNRATGLTAELLRQYGYSID